MKYIVKNCPAFIPQAYEHCCSLDGNYKCEGCVDCLIKRVIEECDKMLVYTQNAEIDIILERRGITDAEKSELYGQCKMARKILNLFDIEEIK